MAKKITGMMLVHNEEGRYLEEVLHHMFKYCNDIVVLDDASTDKTPEIVQSYNNTHYFRHEVHGFYNEWVLRKQLWDYTVMTNPEWIIAMDADEVLEDAAPAKIRQLVNVVGVDAYTFKRYDFWWSKRFYREDPHWQPHNTDTRIQLLHYRPNIIYQWNERPIHCGSVPQSIFQTHVVARSDIRLKHYGWANKKEYDARLARYMAHDPDHLYSPSEAQQRKEIFDPNPTLIKWKE